jgi:hypothetical protein
MPKTKKKRAVVQLGAITGTFRPGFKANPRRNPWKWEFYIRPSTDEGNEFIAMYLKQFGDIEEFKRNLELPGYPEKEPVYAVKKSIMDNIEKSPVFWNTCKAFVRYQEGGKIYRYRTAEQIEKARKRRAKKDLKKTQSVSSPAT